MRAFVLTLTTLVVSISFASASEPKEPPTLMTTRGKLLKEEPFKNPNVLTDRKDWYIYKGDFSIQNEALRSIEKKEDGHHPAMSTKLPSHNLIMQCKFRTDASNWLALSLDNGQLKEHVFRAWISPTGFSLKRMSGMGSTTKGETIAEKKFKFDPAKWYTMIVEIHGKEVCGMIPEANLYIYGEHDALDMDKDRFELISGGNAAWFDEIKIWEAGEISPRWPQVKASLPRPVVPKK
jgi:hypothetical protein